MKAVFAKGASFYLFIFFLVSSKVLIGWILVHKCLPNNVVGLTWKFPLIAPVERGVLCTGSKSLSSSLEPEKSTRYYIELMSLLSSVYIILGWLIWLKIIFRTVGLKNIILPTWGQICLSSVTTFVKNMINMYFCFLFMSVSSYKKKKKKKPKTKEKKIKKCYLVKNFMEFLSISNLEWHKNLAFLFHI